MGPPITKLLPTPLLEYHSQIFWAFAMEFRKKHSPAEYDILHLLIEAIIASIVFYLQSNETGATGFGY